MALFHLLLILLPLAHSTTQHNVVMICFYGAKGDADPIKQECEKNLKEMEECGIKVHQVFQGPFKDKAARESFLADLAKKDRFPADADFFVDSHGDQKIERFRLAGTADDGTSFFSEQGEKFASSREVFTALEKSAPDAPVWVDACRAGGCAKVGKLRVGAACGFDEYSRMDGPFEKRLIKLLCHSQRNQCKEWYDADKNRDGVITAGELSSDFCRAFQKKEIEENELIPTKDNPKYFDRVEALKSECGAVEVKSGYLFTITGHYEEIDLDSLRDDTPRLKTFDPKPIVPTAPRTIKHEQTFNFGVFETPEAASAAAEKLAGWKKGNCHPNEGFRTRDEVTARKHNALRAQQNPAQFGRDRFDGDDADHSLSGCKLKQSGDAKFVLARCKKTVPFHDVDSPSGGKCQQCPQLGGFVLRSPNCRENAAPGAGPHGSRNPK